VVTYEEVISSDNEGLAFIWIPTLLSKLPYGGRLFSTLFFIAFFFAALSSLISMVELGVRFFSDMNIERKKSTLLVIGLGIVFGIPSALSSNFLHNQDWVWGIGLLISGIFLIISVISYGVEKFRVEFLHHPANSYNPGRWFNYVIIFLLPLEFMAMIGWWFYQAIKWSDKSSPWWSIFEISSIGTCLFQWAILIIALLILNNLIYKKNITSDR